jgi:hypothetical protein
MTRQRELGRRAARARFWSRVSRALWASGAGLGGLAVAAEWTGFDWLSGPLAIGALGTMLLAFAVTTLPTVTDNRDGGDDAPLPYRPGGADPD